MRKISDRLPLLAIIAVFGGLNQPIRTETVPDPTVRIANPGFEEGGNPPSGWSRDMQKNGAKGRVSLDTAKFHGGRAALRLEPNARNTGDQTLSVGQIFPAGGLRGRRIEISGFLAAEGGATAVLGVLSIVKGKPADIATITLGSGGSGFAERRQSYRAPDDPSLQLGIFCAAAGTAGAAWFDDIAITPEPAESSARGALSSTIEIDARTVVREIPRTLFGANVEWIWNGNGLWAGPGNRFDPKLLEFARDLNLSLLRYPGGLYSDFYHWKAGVGPREKRPKMLHQAGETAASVPNFGTDEALEFARRIGAELLITVNAGTGTAQEAADWVRYVNGKELRVRYWEVGNELYINDGSATSRAITIGPEAYARRFLEFARAMRAADGRIRIGAIGGQNEGRYGSVGYRDWDRILLSEAGREMDFLSVHNGYAPGVSDNRAEARSVYGAMFAAPAQTARNLGTVASQIARYAPGGKKISIAATEWGPLFQVDPRGSYVDHNKTLGSALYAASELKALIESPSTTIANFHVLNDVGIMGWIGSRGGVVSPAPDWTPTARYYAFQLFSKHFGPRLVRATENGPAYDTRGTAAVDPATGIQYLDVTASLSEDGNKLMAIAINRHFDSAIEGSISIRGFTPASGEAWTLNGTGIDANTGTAPLRIPELQWAKQKEDTANPRFYRGGPEEVRVTHAPVDKAAASFRYRFPAHSATALVLVRGK